MNNWAYFLIIWYVFNALFTVSKAGGTMTTNVTGLFAVIMVLWYAFMIFAVVQAVN